MALFQKLLRCLAGEEIILDGWGVAAIVPLGSDYSTAIGNDSRLRLFDSGGNIIADLKIGRGPIKFYSPQQKIHSAQICTPAGAPLAVVLEGVIAGTEDDFLPDLLPSGFDSAGLRWPHNGMVTIDRTASIHTSQALLTTGLFSVAVDNVAPSAIPAGGAVDFNQFTIQNLGPNPLLVSKSNPPTEADSHLIQGGGDVWTLRQNAGVDLYLLARTAPQVAPADTRISMEVY